MTTTTVSFPCNGERGAKEVTVSLDGEKMVVVKAVTRIEFLETGMVHFVGKTGSIIPSQRIVSIVYD